MPRFKDQAICIRDYDWSETSQLVVMLTQTRGKVRGLAKGARRQSPSSVARFSGGINLLNRGEVLATTRPSTPLAAITEWDLQDDHYHLRTSFPAQRLAMYGADLCNAMLADEDPHPGLFEALSQFLTALVDPRAHDAALLAFQWAVLSDCGFGPELSRDVETQAPLPNGQALTFDPKLGGFTQRKAMGDDRWGVRPQTREVLLALARHDAIAHYPPETLARANRLLCVYTRALLDSELPTMSAVLGAKARA